MNFRKAFTDEFNASFKRYLLTAFVTSQESRIEMEYEVKNVCR